MVCVELEVRSTIFLSKVVLSSACHTHASDSAHSTFEVIIKRIKLSVKKNIYIC